MSEAEFKKHLQHIYDRLLEMLEEGTGELDLTVFDGQELTLGQQEIVRRIRTVNPHANDFDDGCEACREMYGSSVHQTRQAIAKYLQGKYTDAREVITATYEHTDGTDSFSVLAMIVDGVPQLARAYRNNNLEMIQSAFQSQADLVDVREITFPGSLGEYIKNDTVSTGTYFSEEL